MRIHDSLHKQPNPKPLALPRKKGKKSFQEHLEENLETLQGPSQPDRESDSHTINLTA